MARIKSQIACSRGILTPAGKKIGINYYGYKNSICIDVDHGFIRRYAVHPPISMTDRFFRACLTPKISTTMSGQTQRIPVNASRIY